ncbi:uncharacterized protein QC764_0109630 [Podospora pseudoanserina]|uniref:Uncharacterized protein n=1 Tax=Podospora pseudoanserina TaxID=2609844 RepID=A0ABR0HIV5_9PEZI|nr:hypothetical protein QC764_0109630 [Podospora pseudoanserina]
MPPLLQDSLEQGVSRLSHLLNGSHPRQELNPQGPQPRDRTSVDDGLMRTHNRRHRNTIQILFHWRRRHHCHR